VRGRRYLAVATVRLCLITDRRLMGRPDGAVDPDRFGAAIAAAVRDLPDRVALIQVREKDVSGADLLRLTGAAVAAAPAQLVTVNDRLDVAVAAGADGVHLPEDGMAPDLARAVADRLVPDHPRGGLLVLCSRHSYTGAMAAGAAGADGVQLGPIWATPSKAGLGEPLGTSALTAVRRGRADLWLAGVGGIDGRARAREVRAAGADAVAVIRAVWTAEDPGAAVFGLIA